ncbi:MAG: MATE family efflux transporter [Lachnospiraceae bacterium]
MQIMQRKYEWLSRYFGNKDFYKMLLLIAIPIMIQTGFSNLVNLIDNIMVGRLGTEQMSGVAIVNQMMMVFNICIFGATSAAGIFGAQFYGKKDVDGIRYTFRFKIVSIAFIFCIGILVFYLFGEPLVKLYLHSDSNTDSIAATLNYAKDYLRIAALGMLPFVVTQSYASTLRETGETMLPMKAGIVAVVSNMILDFILIFGLFFIPGLGIRGAAIATVAARFIEMGMILRWVTLHREEVPYFKHVFSHFHIPTTLVKQIIIKGFPLLLNEVLWSFGMAVLMQSYSTRGLDVVAALNISTTVTNLFNIFFFAMGSAISIIVGQLLGAGKLEEAVDTDRKIIVFSIIVSGLIGSVLLFLSSYIPQFYNTSADVKSLAMDFLKIFSVFMPIQSFVAASYFTLRSGGKTWITFIFDSVFIWVVTIPLAYYLTRETTLSIILIFLICQSADMIKAAIGYFMVKRRLWVQNITIHV